MKKFFEEFKAFALKGNVMDLAVAVIIGGAFQNIIKALIENLINPLIGILFQADLSLITLNVGPVSFGIGAFISAVINFILLALVLFILVKMVNSMKKPKAAEAPAKPADVALLEQILEELKKR